jgi:hypothetical protein
MTIIAAKVAGVQRVAACTPRGLGQPVATVTGFADDLDVGLGLRHGAPAQAHQGMTVNEQNPDGLL